MRITEHGWLRGVRRRVKALWRELLWLFLWWTWA